MDTVYVVLHVLNALGVTSLVFVIASMTAARLGADRYRTFSWSRK